MCGRQYLSTASQNNSILRDHFELEMRILYLDFKPKKKPAKFKLMHFLTMPHIAEF